MIYGYARVSTDGQSVAAQVAQLTDAGAVKVFQETASGAKTDRRELARAIKGLEADDTSLVTRLGRLVRSVFEPFAIAKKIIDTGGQFFSLAEPWADTSSSAGRLMIAVLAGGCGARLDPHPHRRRARPRQFARLVSGATVENDGDAETGSAAKAQGRGGLRRSCAHLRRQPCRHLPNDGTMVFPSRRK